MDVICTSTEEKPYSQRIKRRHRLLLLRQPYSDIPLSNPRRERLIRTAAGCGLHVGQPLRLPQITRRPDGRQRHRHNHAGRSALPIRHRHQHGQHKDADLRSGGGGTDELRHLDDARQHADEKSAAKRHPGNPNAERFDGEQLPGVRHVLETRQLRDEVLPQHGGDRVHVGHVDAERESICACIHDSLDVIIIYRLSGIFQ